MEKTLFMRAAEVAEVLGVSETYAYMLICFLINQCVL